MSQKLPANVANMKNSKKLSKIEYICPKCKLYLIEKEVIEDVYLLYCKRCNEYNSSKISI